MPASLYKTILLLLILFLLSSVSSSLAAGQAIAEDIVSAEQATTVEPAQQQVLTDTDTEEVKKLSPPPAVAALATKPSQKNSAGLSLTKMAISLAIVVLIVLVLGWTFKKLTLRLPGSRHIKIISTTSLGPKEKLLVIEMQGKQRVLGVTANSINLLFELESPLPEEKLASDFHIQLQSFLKK
ncbi:flagellar biosynthetic protein FliO [Rheinheimera sp. MMS21-TC3]|uniref:flagellar biosynthetic protein FliO n=1 Tax=Rheinheimera sp. MMS21-TC3 TaxID=3072790 RepID=UPI0028C45BDC|nr:flagellar biosynthetic protein FliO [Rheinheimera sp. MMS21-TC3]WNO61788.1 flagellar biosynthetic protein FliO [Rheinheimera sp. MMS21-TC3]